MSRILKAYRTRFHQMLKQTGARRVDQGVEWLVTQARKLSDQKSITLAEALSLISERLASKPVFVSAQPRHAQTPTDISFFCDSGLGGLARWLRAAGYVAFWEPEIADDELLARSRQTATTLLTTDSMLMERRILRDRLIPSMWLPPTLSSVEAMERVFKAFQLRAGSPRCMSCGGELVRSDKEALRERIPPKTYCWLNDYFVCNQCGKLFWHGTHWLKIVNRLRALDPSGP
jgi:uncharacterized protein